MPKPEHDRPAPAGTNPAGAPPAGGSPGASPDPKLSRASVGRFSLYLRHLDRLARDGTATVSSGQLGDALGITDAQVRKDLAYLGNLGQPGIGYPTPELIRALRNRLGVDRLWNVAVVGVGNLARALLRYRGFEQQGFKFVALFDAEPAKVGEEIDGLKVYAMSEMAAVVKEQKVELGVVAVPAAAAQEVTDALVAAGIEGILNFAPTVLRLPTGVSLVSVDMAVQLEQLAFLVHLGQAGT